MCHCGITNVYAECCGRLIEGGQNPDSAESLMRSRYSAFVIKNMEYLQVTEDPQTRSFNNQEDNRKFAESVEFTGLQVIFSSEKGNKATVEFIANYRDLITGEVQMHHEVSQFRQQAGVWLYRQGRMLKS